MFIERNPTMKLRADLSAKDVSLQTELGVL